MNLAIPHHLKSRFSRVVIRTIQSLALVANPNRIVDGPFSKIKIPRNSFGSAYAPKIMGTYESEIAGDVKNLLLDGRFSCFCDIGCAGGYYIAICRSLRPEMTIIGVDANRRAIEACRRYLQDGNIEYRVEFASISTLDYVTERHLRAVFLVDIEGSEYDLFSRADIESFRNHAFIIESHEYCNVGSVDLCRLLSATHDVKIVTYVRKERGAYKFGVFGRLWFQLLSHELRNPQTKYIVATPKKA